MATEAGLGTAPRAASPDRPAGRARPGLALGGWTVSDRLATGLAAGLVALPFAVALVRLLLQPAGHLTLPDDLALIDLHTRRAMAWRQQLGVFDRNGWSHPGPSYFYVLGVVYRVFGSSARSLFAGAVLLNGAAAVACVAVVRRATSPARALWAASVVSLLAFGLADSGAGATTYSETVLGALVSPWNPMVVILPMLLLLLLAAVAATGSGLAGVGVLLVGSYVVQTDISTLPLVAVVVLLAVGTWFVGSLRGRRRRAAAVAASEAGSHWAGPQAGPPSAVLGDAGRAGGAGRARRTDRRADRRADRAGMAAAAGLVLLVAMWVPPVVEQLTHHPGNLTLLYRYFTSGAAGQSWGTALSASGAALAVFVAGPSEVMPWVLWGAQPHHALNALCLVATLGLGVGAAVAGLRSRSWFAACLGGLSAVGALVVVVAAVHVIGLLFGYLLVWAAVLPASSLVAAGAVRLPDGWVAGVRRAFGPSGARLLLVLLLAVPCSATVARVLATPPLSRASDPQVGRLAALVRPGLRPGEAVAVNDADAGTASTRLLDLERFFGLVDLLDRAGVRPRVNRLWQVELGPGYAATGREPVSAVLETWTPSSPREAGYRGRVGDMAVRVLGRVGASPGPATAATATGQESGRGPAA